MALGKQINDKELLRSVNKKLLQRGGGNGCKVVATVASGVVTLSGVLENEFQRRPLLSSMSESWASDA